MSLPPGASSRDRWIDLADQARDKAREALANGDRRMAGLWDEHERTLLRNAYEDVPFSDAGAPATGGQPTGTVGDLTGPINSGNPFDELANDPDLASPRSVADGPGVQVADESAAAMWPGLAAAGLVGAAEMARQHDPLAVLNAITKQRREEAQAIDRKGREIRQRGTEFFPSSPPPFPATPIPPRETQTSGFPSESPISPEEMQTPGFPSESPVSPEEMQTPALPGDPFDVNGIQPIVMKGAKFPTAQHKGKVFSYPELSPLLEFPTIVESHRGDPRTQNHMDGARDKLIVENPDCEHIAGGRDADTGAQIPEQYILNPTPPPGKDGRTGSVQPDMTFKCADGSFIYVNTVDVYKNGKLKPREEDAIRRLATRIGKNDRIVTIPKPWQMK